MYNRKLADKFFNNQCTTDEANQVLQWLDTSKGKEYLSEKMEDDLLSFDESPKTDEHEAELGHSLKSFEPDHNFSEILSTITLHEQAEVVRRRKEYIAPLLKIAAGFLVIAMTSLFVYTSETYTAMEEVIPETVLATNADEQREVTLGDGTVIHLNKQSTVTLSGDYMESERKVYLEGEAYFEVAHHASRPFIIQTDYSEITVLGTSFNVKTDPEAGLIEVAVLDGSVSFKDTRVDGSEQVVLLKGEYAYLDLFSQQIVTENFGVVNYLAWKNGEFRFDQLSLDQVCLQLSRFYDVICEFENENLKARRLTANFPNDDLENIFAVIASSLHLGFEADGNRVNWQEVRLER